MGKIKKDSLYRNMQEASKEVASWKDWQKKAMGLPIDEVDGYIVKTLTRVIYKEIKHGDKKHQKWLKDNLKMAIEKALQKIGQDYVDAYIKDYID